jgi:hypothetical protein
MAYQTSNRFIYIAWTYPMHICVQSGHLVSGLSNASIQMGIYSGVSFRESVLTLRIDHWYEY